MSWKDIFYFTKTERQGILLLVFLLAGAFATPTLIALYTSPSSVSATDSIALLAAQKEYLAFVASLQEDPVAAKNKKYEKREKNFQPKAICLRPFDPNTADSLTFVSVGLPPWMARNILRYRRKQGRFRKVTDFQKVYGLTQEQFTLLRPYIHIADSFQQKDTTQLWLTHSTPRDSLYKYQPGTVVELNTADTTELKKIPGIGSGIARRIIQYRNKLGGYYQLEQLQEIHLKAEKLRPWFHIDTQQITPIQINKVSLERLMRHPYLNFYQAKVIIEYRKKKGPIQHVKQLSLYEEFSAADLDRLQPYLRCDE